MLLCPWDFPGKNIVEGCHFLLHGIFLTQGSNTCFLRWQKWLFTTEPPGKPFCTVSQDSKRTPSQGCYENGMMYVAWWLPNIKCSVGYFLKKEEEEKWSVKIINSNREKNKPLNECLLHNGLVLVYSVTFVSNELSKCSALVGGRRGHDGNENKLL